MSRKNLTRAREICNDYAGAHIDSLHYLYHILLCHSHTACRVLVFAKTVEEYRRTFAYDAFLVEIKEEGKVVSVPAQDLEI